MNLNKTDVNYSRSFKVPVIPNLLKNKIYLK